MQIMHFTPPQLARILSINETTIKRWIWSGKLKANQTAGGHYRVTRDQLANFVDKYPRYAKNSYVVNRLTKSKKSAIEDWCKFYDLLLKNKRVEAEKLIQTLYLSGLSIIDILDNYISPALKNIGEEWVKGNISIYEEHRMSFLVDQTLTSLSQLAPQKGSRQKTAVLACVKGDTHILPLMMVDLVLRLEGWRTHVLGINLPASELKKAIEKVNPSLVCLTKLLSDNNTRDYLRQALSAKTAKKFTLAVGGSGWQKNDLNLKSKNPIEQFTSLKEFSQFINK